MTDYAIVLCGLCGMLCLWSSFNQLRYAVTSSNWPRADAVVTRSYLELSCNAQGQLALHGNRKRHHWNLRYQFTVNGVTYKNHRASFSVVEFPHSKKKMQTLIDAFPVASRHSVYYLPSDPNISTLMPGFRWNTAVLPALGLAFLAVGVQLYR